ncbi:MAG: glyoxalase [Cyanobacteria bacterium RYN_339]|nr:glyoxalase [Cyanobacteria bacterium RYN_339]
MIKGIDFVSLQVADMARAQAFYQEKLGLPPVATAGEGWAEFDLGPGPALTLLDPTAFGQAFEEERGSGSFGLAVHDIETVSAEMEAEDRLHMDMFETDGCHGAPMSDSEGNGLMLHRRKAEPGRNRVIDFVCLPVADTARARAFYKEMFGIEPTPESGEIWTEYVFADDSALALFNGSKVGIAFSPSTGNAPGLATPELEALMAKFKAKGLTRADTPIETPVCFMGLVSDSEGNALVLHRHK